MRRLRAVANPARQVGTLGRPQRLADEVYEAILGQLMSLKIPPGGAINIDDLAREFGVSQTPIREALGHLEAYGLVIKTQFIGYTAAPQLTKVQFDELCELRLRLEPYLAAKAAENMDDHTAASLQQLVDSMTPPKPGDAVSGHSQFASQDAVLHDRIAAAAGNSLMREMLANLHTHLHLFRRLRTVDVMDDAVSAHADIIKALTARDSKGAEEAMRVHIEKVQERLASVFERDEAVQNTEPYAPRKNLAQRSIA